MASNNSYNEFYENGSAARKREYVVNPGRAANKNLTKGKTKVQVRPKKNYASLIVFILCGFAMTMFVIYRYNVINEKNLDSQTLKKQLEQAEAGLLTAQIEVEQNTDLNKIEAYAKQQLGMQKPDKNQTIYVDTSKTSKSVEITQEKSGIEKFFSSVIDAIKNIF